MFDSRSQRIAGSANKSHANEVAGHTRSSSILDFLASTVRPEAGKAAPKEFYDIPFWDRLEKGISPNDY